MTCVLYLLRYTTQARHMLWQFCIGLRIVADHFPLFKGGDTDISYVLAAILSILVTLFLLT